MSKTRGAGLDVLATLATAERTVAALAEDLGAEYWNTYSVLRGLLAKGLVRREGAQPHGHTYFVTVKGRKELNGRVARGVRGRLPPVVYARHGETMPKHPNPKQRRRIRDEVHNRDRWRCHYCGGPGDTVDHIVPRYMGGPYTAANLVCACEPCNTAKGLLSYEDFLAVRALGAVRQADVHDTGHDRAEGQDEV